MAGLLDELYHGYNYLMDTKGGKCSITQSRLEIANSDNLINTMDFQQISGVYNKSIESIESIDRKFLTNA